jgi:hypothetical protein
MSIAAHIETNLDGWTLRREHLTTRGTQCDLGDATDIVLQRQAESYYLGEQWTQICNVMEASRRALSPIRDNFGTFRERRFRRFSV